MVSGLGSGISVTFLGSMRRYLLWPVVLGLSACALGSTAKPITVGIPTSQFNFVAATQAQTEWCWAASVQMILNWYNVPVKQSDVVNRIYHRAVDAAASEDAITVALSGTAYDRRGRKVRLQAERRRGTPAAGELMSEMSLRHPMLVTVHSTRRMLHAVVVTSVETIDGDEGSTITAITFRDPKPNLRGRHTAGSVRVSGSDLTRFLSSISSYYLVSVKA